MTWLLLWLQNDHGKVLDFEDTSAAGTPGKPGMEGIEGTGIGKAGVKPGTGGSWNKGGGRGGEGKAGGITKEGS